MINEINDINNIYIMKFLKYSIIKKINDTKKISKYMFTSTT